MTGKKLAMSATSTLTGILAITTAPDPAAAHSLTLVSPYRTGTVILDETHSDLTVCSWHPDREARAIFTVGVTGANITFEVEGYGCDTTRLMVGITQIKACDSTCTGWKRP